MNTDRSQQLTFGDRRSQQVTVDFQGGQVVTDAGLLPTPLARPGTGRPGHHRPTTPRSRAQKFVTHSAEALLTQEVYQILAGYPDGNDAQILRDAPLFQTLVGMAPDTLDD